MFVCRACVRSLTGTGATPIGPRLLTPLRRSAGPVSGRRTYTGKDIKIDLRSAIADPTLHAADEASSSEAKRSSRRQPVDEGHEFLRYEHQGSVRGDEYGKQKYEKKLEAAVRKRLELYTDPWHIAQHVSQALERGAFDEALLMTRMASRKRKVEVSWNHLIDYQMTNRRLHAAVKLYNEMKKRGQIPNAKTYTIIFRGCAESVHPKLGVAEATRIYNFMCKQGALKPNTIHMNAVLEVCARAGDLESLFVVLGTSNEKLRNPDSVTYTIVLNALRHDARSTEKPDLGLVDAEVRREIKKNIQTARKIWYQVIAHWKGAKMIIDESLVCAMGRVLAEGDYNDNDEILDLLEQTMKIPRLDKPRPGLGSGASREDDAGTEATAANSLSGPDKQAPDITDMSPKARRELAASGVDKSPLYAKPRNKTLSLALTALCNTRKTSHAARYWDYFTRILDIKPDHENYVCYLRALASGHASAQVAALVETMPADVTNHLTFRRALNACIKDNLNKDAFKNACRIFDVMAARQRYPDALAMRLFLHVARASTRHFYERAEPVKSEEAASPSLHSSAGAEDTEAHGRQIISAVDRMWEPFRILTGSLSYPEGPTRSPEEELAKKRGDMQEIMATARRMIAAIDRVVVDDGMCHDRKMVKLLRTRRVILQKMLERWILKLYPDGPPSGENKVNNIREEMEMKEEEEEEEEEKEDKRAAEPDRGTSWSHFVV